MTRGRDEKRNGSRRRNRYEDSYEDYDDYKPSIPRYDKPIPVTENHRSYHSLCRNPEKKIVLAKGWAGTGKSIVAAWYAAQALKREGKRIVITRSLEGVGKDPGSYPGTAYEKNEPKLKQLINYISSFTGRDVATLLMTEDLKVIGLHDIQGQDLTGCWLIVTESQTLTAEQMYLIVTRGADKIILEGDTCEAQSVAKSIRTGKDGLSFLMHTIGDLNEVGVVSMDAEEDIVRQDYLKQIIMRMMPSLETWNMKG